MGRHELKIGFDLDGVLADFTTRYWDIMAGIQGTGKIPGDFIPGAWHWEREAGFTKETEDAAWRFIGASEDFWTNLSVLPDAVGLDLITLSEDNELVFITNRKTGKDPKYQSELWLTEKFGLRFPTVILVKDKGPVVDSLGLDIFIDDRDVNIMSILKHAPRCQPVILDYPYNRTFTGLEEARIMRISSLGEIITDGHFRTGAC